MMEIGEDNISCLKHLIFEVFSSGNDDKNFSYGDFWHIDRRWIKRSNYETFILYEGGMNIDDDIVAYINRDFSQNFYILPEKSLFLDILESDLVPFNFNTADEFRDFMIEKDGLYYDNYILFSSSFDLVMHVLEEELIIVTGFVSRLESYFKTSYKDMRKSFYEYSDFNENAVGAKYYWGERWWDK
ncbi:hypothetical protein VIBNISOn1_30150 [Vibrio nigripulchritudo SOn1]|uniref:Uncharacterized protein n=1 Tax=Vibrio nigripulchritudo SOn1 TaxID=1238450 RepID=A0AAV2VSC0_9VIBR|nr:hypothetical protein [Vibrio nigripulchritudo]CCO47455.1 hypothetical protein VIBNISOn1_30150 [Vibrio nigripulchritudo SOn1]